MSDKTKTKWQRAGCPYCNSIDGERCETCRLCCSCCNCELVIDKPECSD